MLPVIYYTPAEKYFKKIKDKNLKNKFKEAIHTIRMNPYIGERKKGDLAGIYAYDIYYNKTNYEIAYIIEKQSDASVLIIIMAGTRENFWDIVKKYIG